VSLRRLPRWSLGALALLALPPAGAGAQDGIASEEECARASSPEEELACLRAALAASREALRRAEPPPPPAPPAQPQRREVATAPAAAPTAADRPPELGQEQVARAEPTGDGDENRAGTLKARVTDVREDQRGLLVMQLDNGQIWRQDDIVGGPIPLGESRQASVEITRSGFGGYRMRFPELGRRIAVSRLR